MAVRIRDQGRQGNGEHRLEFLPETPFALFEHFVAYETQDRLVSVFRSVLTIVHNKQLVNYHNKVQNGWRGSKWKVVLLCGDTARIGPKLFSLCMSCDLDCPVNLGITGQGEGGKL